MLGYTHVRQFWYSTISFRTHYCFKMCWAILMSDSFGIPQLVFVLITVSRCVGLYSCPTVLVFHNKFSYSLLFQDVLGYTHVRQFWYSTISFHTHYSFKMCWAIPMSDSFGIPQLVFILITVSRCVGLYPCPTVLVFHN